MPVRWAGQVGGIELTSVDILELRQIGGMTGTGISLSPDGRWAALEVHRANLAVDNYEVGWFVVSTIEPDVFRNVGDAGDAMLFRAADPNGYINGAYVSPTATWSPDGKWIAYRRMVNSEIQIWRSNFEGTLQERLTDCHGDVLDFRWMDDGEHMVFSHDASRKDIGQARAVQARKGYVIQKGVNWNLVPARPFFPQFVLTDGEPRISTLDLDTRDVRTATGAETEWFRQRTQAAATRKDASQDEAGYFPHSRATQNAAVAMFQTPRPTIGRSLVRLGILDRRAAKVRYCTSAPCAGMIEVHASAPSWHASGRTLYFVRREGVNFTRRSIYSWSIASGVVERIFETSAFLSDCHFVDYQAVCFLQTATSPRKLVSIDLTNGRLVTLFDPNPEFTRFKVAEAQYLDWRTPSGRDVAGVLIKPLGFRRGERYPLVVLDYRIGDAIRGASADITPAQVLAANGFAVLVYDFPDDWEAAEESRSIGEFIQRVLGDGGTEIAVPVEAITAGIGYLAKIGIVDPARVGITGFSTGIPPVLNGLLTTNTFAAAVVTGTWSPTISELSPHLTDELREAWDQAGLDKREGRNWPRLAIDLNSGDVEAALLINVSDSEYLSSLSVVRALQDAKKPVEMRVFPEEYHVRWSPAHRYAGYETGVQWFLFWLKNQEVTSPFDPDQYRRWQALREIR